MWTSIPKPITPTYTNVNPMGREQYDQTDVFYDDPNVFYDGINPNQWTDVSKPVSGQITWNDLNIPWKDDQEPWNATGASWVKVPKP